MTNVMDRYYHSYSPGSHRLARSRFWSRLAFLSFLGVVVVAIFLIIIFPIFALGLPSPEKIVRTEGFSTQIYDRNGKLLYNVYDKERRTPVVFDDIPIQLRQATVAVEDKNFYKHGGFDPTGILRATMDIFLKRRLEGGSTLTQQLVKTVLLTPERTIFRKIREFILAVQIERKYSKDQILHMYLNEAPYGGTARGVEAASQMYFGKHVKDLNLVECAILAGMPQRPSYYSPYSTNPKAYIDRTAQVLRRMREDGYITVDQENQAKSQLTNVQFQPPSASFKAPHFIMYVQQLLEDRYGEAAVQNGGLKITTTLDTDLQDQAQQIVSEEIGKVENLHITNGASVVLDAQTGEILAMVGSKNFSDPNYDGQVNVALALRQPGSAIKPVTYLTALKKGYTPSTVLMDVLTTFPGGAGQPDYKPENYDGKYRGPLQLRFALANSINTVAVKLLSLVGVKDMLKTAYDLGITTLEPTQQNLSRLGLSVTLGGGEVKLLELTAAYGAFANGGAKVTPIAILKVEDRNGRVLEEIKPGRGKQVITPTQAFIISDILSDPNARADVFGTHSALAIPGRTVAAKTGTTNDKRDNWTIGWTANQIVAGVWVGNNDNSPMKQVSSGVTGAAPIWRRIMQAAIKDKPNVLFAPPDGVVKVDVDTVSGYSAHDGYPTRQEYFISGTEPTGNDPIHTKLKVCKNEGKIATPSDVSSGNYEEKEYFIFKENDPSGSPNRWQEAIDAWLTNQSDARYHPPSDYCGSVPLNVDFQTPTDKQQNLNTTFEVKIQADSVSQINSVELNLDGQKVEEFNAPPYKTTISTTNGSHVLYVKATDTNGKTSDRTITVFVGPMPSPSPSPSPTPH